MKIMINGLNKDFNDQLPLNIIVEQSSPNSDHVITELNGEIIKRSQWAQTVIRDGDRIELVGFVGGG